MVFRPTRKKVLTISTCPVCGNGHREILTRKNGVKLWCRECNAEKSRRRYLLKLTLAELRKKRERYEWLLEEIDAAIDVKIDMRLAVRRRTR
jgi:ssDNA-binding Zn-finger/Zn-ribbon topoisomerase 1